MIRILTIVLALLGPPGLVSATPDPAVIVRDHAVAATPSSLFVVRVVTHLPPTYYAARETAWLLEISVWDGRVRRRCLLRDIREEWHPDLGRAAATLRVSGPDQGCTQEGFIETPANLTFSPTDFTPPKDVALRLDPETLTLRVIRQGQSHVLAGQDYVTSRLRATLNHTDVACTDDGRAPACDLTRFDNCRLTTPHKRDPETGWNFLAVQCGTQDASHFSAYLPISAASWARVNGGGDE